MNKKRIEQLLNYRRREMEPTELEWAERLGPMHG